MSDFELEELMVKAKTDELSERDIDLLLETFVETFGSIKHGMNLHPYWILRKRKHDKYQDDDAVDKWYELDNDFEVELKDINIDFMCQKPKVCVSHQLYGEACDCIRRNFNSPAEYKLWRENTILDMGNKLLDIDTKKN